MNPDAVVQVLRSDVYPALAKPIPPHTQPEAYTKSNILEPLLSTLGYPHQYRLPEFRPGHTSPGWVDYLLRDSSGEPVAFVEAKSFTETGLWERHSKQVRQYIRDYRYSPGAEDVKTVRWLVLTNGREWHVLSVIDRDPKPFRRTLILGANPEADAAELAVFARENLSKLLADYNESRNTPLGVSFLQDLRSWREHLARALHATDPLLAPAELSELSQRLLDQLIFIRALENSGLQPSFGLLRYFANFKSNFRNRKARPFGLMLANFVADLEADLNTELLKAWHPTAMALLDTAFEPIIQPDSSMPGQSLIQNSLYNYDFRDLTFDLLGEVYEQYLGHELRLSDGKVSLLSSRAVRGAQGAFYTPAPVVEFATELALADFAAVTDAAALAKNTLSLRIVDIACGSGAFLLSAFRSLVRLRQRYNELLFASADLLTTTGIQPFASDHELVATHLYGIDKDEDAVDIARLNLWLELIRTAPTALNRSEHGKDKLPQLGEHVIKADSLQDATLIPYFDIMARLGISQFDQVVVVGNPPWGADLSGYEGLKDQYETFMGAGTDSAGLFVERILESMPLGGTASLVLPDSILLRTRQHALIRQILCRDSTINYIARLGEGFFPGVFRSAIVVCFKKQNPNAAHKTRCFIFAKADRESPHREHLLGVFQKSAWEIRQADLGAESETGWRIFATDLDRAFLRRLVTEHVTIRDFVQGRGVELNKFGTVVQCADCAAFNPPARGKNKADGRTLQPWEKKCHNCSRKMRSTSTVRSLIDQDGPSVPFVMGDEMHRLEIRRVHTLSLRAASWCPACPHCGYTDVALSYACKGNRKCVSCNKIFAVANSKRKKVGIDYKAASLYNGEKVLLREAGRGVYAALDSNSYVAKSVYILRTDGTPYDAPFLAGVLSSRVILYWYYKAMGILEWQSFPRMPLNFVQTLPFPKLNMMVEGDRLLHADICHEVLRLSRFPGRAPDKRDDTTLEILVRRAFGMTVEESEVVDGALSYVAKFGPLLGEAGSDYIEQ